MLLIVYAHNISCWDCVSLSGLEKFLDRDSLSQIVINHGSRGGWIEVAPRSEVKIRPVTLRLKRLLHGCVDNLRRTRLMCEVMSCDKRGKAGFTSVKHFRHFFWTGIWVVVVVVFFFLEREGWITPAHGHRRKTAINWTETRSLHSQHYLTSFLWEPGLVSASSLGVLSWSVVRAKSRWHHSSWWSPGMTEPKTPGD